MQIATFNVNSLRPRLPIALDWLDRRRPDILCLQETKVQDHEFPAADILAQGYQVVFKGEKSYNGVAIISRRKADEVQYGFDDDGPADATRLLYARFGKLHVVNTYVPQGRELDHPMFQYKLEWFARLRRYFDRHFKPADALVWMGDLNIAPTAIDIHNAEQQESHVCFHMDVRRAFEQTLAWGFVDIFRKHHPEPGQYSYFDYRARDAVRRNAGWRVDHILASPALAQKSTGSEIDLGPRQAERPSDHTVVAAQFAFKCD